MNPPLEMFEFSDGSTEERIVLKNSQSAIRLSQGNVIYTNGYMSRPWLGLRHKKPILLVPDDRVFDDKDEFLLRLAKIPRIESTFPAAYFNSYEYEETLDIWNYGDPQLHYVEYIDNSVKPVIVLNVNEYHPDKWYWTNASISKPKAYIKKNVGGTESIVDVGAETSTNFTVMNHYPQGVQIPDAFRRLPIKINALVKKDGSICRVTNVLSDQLEVVKLTRNDPTATGEIISTSAAQCEQLLCALTPDDLRTHKKLFLSAKDQVSGIVTFLSSDVCVKLKVGVQYTNPMKSWKHNDVVSIVRGDANRLFINTRNARMQMIDVPPHEGVPSTNVTMTNSKFTRFSLLELPSNTKILVKERVTLFQQMETLHSFNVVLSKNDMAMFDRNLVGSVIFLRSSSDFSIPILEVRKTYDGDVQGYVTSGVNFEYPCAIKVTNFNEMTNQMKGTFVMNLSQSARQPVSSEFSFSLKERIEQINKHDPTTHSIDKKFVIEVLNQCCAFVQCTETIPELVRILFLKFVHRHESSLVTQDVFAEFANVVIILFARCEFVRSSLTDIARYVTRVSKVTSSGSNSKLFYIDAIKTDIQCDKCVVNLWEAREWKVVGNELISGEVFLNQYHDYACFGQPVKKPKPFIVDVKSAILNSSITPKQVLDYDDTTLIIFENSENITVGNRSRQMPARVKQIGVTQSKLIVILLQNDSLLLGFDRFIPGQFTYISCDVFIFAVQKSDNKVLVIANTTPQIKSTEISAPLGTVSTMKRLLAVPAGHGTDIYFVADKARHIIKIKTVPPDILVKPISNRALKLVDRAKPETVVRIQRIDLYDNFWYSTSTKEIRYELDDLQEKIKIVDDGKSAVYYRTFSVTEAFDEVDADLVIKWDQGELIKNVVVREVTEEWMRVEISSSMPIYLRAVDHLNITSEIAFLKDDGKVVCTAPSSKYIKYRGSIYHNKNIKGWSTFAPEQGGNMYGWSGLDGSRGFDMILNNRLQSFLKQPEVNDIISEKIIGYSKNIIDTDVVDSGNISILQQYDGQYLLYRYIETNCRLDANSLDHYDIVASPQSLDIFKLGRSTVGETISIRAACMKSMQTFRAIKSRAVEGSIIVERSVCTFIGETEIQIPVEYFDNFFDGSKYRKMVRQLLKADGGEKELTPMGIVKVENQYYQHIPDGLRTDEECVSRILDPLRNDYEDGCYYRCKMIQYWARFKNAPIFQYNNEHGQFTADKVSVSSRCDYFILKRGVRSLVCIETN